MVNKEKIALYSAALIQGITLVAFPAASTILTNPADYAFSNTDYGSLFIPQSILSISAAALNPTLTRHLSSKIVFFFGLIANFLAMFLLASSVMVMKNQGLAYVMLICATGSLGLGFGLLVPTLNAVSALLYPDKVDSVLLVLNGLLGVGTALAPVFISVFVSLGFWWGLPTALCLLLIVLFLFCLPLHFSGGKLNGISTSRKSLSIPDRFWLFAAFALLYGVMETLNGNWISIYMSKHIHASIKIQSLALTAFWGMVTFGRIFFAALQKFISIEVIFRISPFVSALAFILISFLSPGAEYWAIAAFGLIGFGCAVLLPLIISFGNEQLQSIASSVPGMLISFYLLGYGIAAFGVGPLEDMAHISLQAIYAAGAVIAVLLGIISLFITKTKKTA